MQTLLEFTELSEGELKVSQAVESNVRFLVYLFDESNVGCYDNQTDARGCKIPYKDLSQLGKHHCKEVKCFLLQQCWTDAHTLLVMKKTR